MTHRLGKTCIESTDTLVTWHSVYKDLNYLVECQSWFFKKLEGLSENKYHVTCRS